jgi:alpha-aminoadipate carrier protein LysW
MPKVACPECKEDVFIDAESEQGDTVSCEECEVRLEIVGLDPIEVDVVEDDLSDDFSEDDDY